MQPNIIEVRNFWNNRAELGETSGTRDVILKQLEMETIAKYITDGMSVLDIGCGNGITDLELARRYKVDVVGIDYAESMICAAKERASGQSLKGSVRFKLADVNEPINHLGQFDLVYTERALINLPDWPTQKLAIDNIATAIVSGGRYLLCASSQDGLDDINTLRQGIGLPIITSPWHNRYLRDAELEGERFDSLNLENVDDFSSTYYFISRVVNAWLAAQDGKEPEYEAAINTLALSLPPIGNLGQGRLWVWRKNDDI